MTNSFLTLFILFTLGFTTQVYCQTKHQTSFSTSFSDLGYSAVEQTKGLQLFKKEGNYLVGFNLEEFDISSYQQVDTTKAAPLGTVLDNISSPYYIRIPFQEVVDNNEGAFVVNASFFESYDQSTLLSYPIYDQNNWLTSGSSIYGPVKEPKDEYYGNIELLGLQFGSDHALIDVFEKGIQPSSLYVVSQNYKDHPALILANNRVTRFLLVTTLDENEDGKDEWLILSVGIGTIVDQAKELQQFNKDRYIMTLDGGSSVLFYHPTLGALHKPMKFDPVTFQPTAVDIPHYLVIKPKN